MYILLYIHNFINMKVILCGAQSVGKTTVIDAIPEKYRSLVIKKVIRDIVLKEDLRVNENADICSQSKFFDAYWNLLSSKDSYISDRGLLDVVAYTKNLAEDRQLGMALYWHQLRLFKEWIQNHPDEVYVYIPIEFPIVDDGFRSTDDYYRQGCDNCIREVLDECGIKYIVLRGSVEERNKKFKKLLEDIEKKKKLTYSHLSPVKFKRKKMPTPKFEDATILNTEPKIVSSNDTEIAGKIFRVPIIK